MRAGAGWMSLARKKFKKLKIKTFPQCIPACFLFRVFLRLGGGIGHQALVGLLEADERS